MIAATTHGYPPTWSMGGEVALHRTLVAAGQPVTVLTRTPDSYDLDSVHVQRIATDDVLNVHADPIPIARQLAQVDATVVVTQNELSLPTVKAAAAIGTASIVSVHTPPRFGATIRDAIRLADAAIYNTHTSAIQWGEPDALVIHPPTGPLPANLMHGDAYTLLSSLRNKGVNIVLQLAARMPQQRFIIVRSPAEPTHGLPDLQERASVLPNVELHPRVTPDQVADRYLSQTRILLVPSRYETYGMSAIEAAGYGIPSVHVDTAHVREGIGDAAILVPALNVDATEAGISMIESDYSTRSHIARSRAEWLTARQDDELDAWADYLPTARPLTDRQRRRRRVA